VAEASARRLADWCAAVRPGEVPAPQMELAKLRILDTVGLVLAAADTAPARAVLDLVATQGGGEEGTLIGSARRLPAASAALAHATLAHCRDFDDTYADTVVHPGSTVVSTALAVGEAVGADGFEMLAAIAVGYEVAARLGAAAGRKFHRRGFHATGIVGPLAAAAAAGRLYRLSGQRIAAAMGLAGSMSGGLMEFLADGAWSKWLHTGWSAHGGIVAAQLAARGFRGPETVLDGRYGLYAAFLGEGEAELGPVTAGLGRDWRGGAALFKYYPCAHVIQPFIDAALALRAEHRLAAADIAEVRCTVPPWAVPIVCEPRPRKLRPENDLEAIASLPFLVAAALADGRVDLDTLDSASLARADLRRMAALIRHREDAALTAGFDGRFEMTAKDGSGFERAATSAAPDAGKLRDKFRRNAARTWPEPRIRAVEDALAEGRDLDVPRLVDALRDK
jgi:2-methylcitrate dehydratase PrpD